MLRRMVKRGELKCQEFDTVADWFMLPSTQRIKDPRKYHHEHGGADLFVAFYPTLRDQGGRWAYEPFVRKERADRAMAIFDKRIFIEVDRATESKKEIQAKLDNYITYARETGKVIHTVFAVMDNPRKSAKNRGLEILPLLIERERRNQFLVASHERWCSDPLGKVLFSPLNETYSVQDSL